MKSIGEKVLGLFLVPEESDEAKRDDVKDKETPPPPPATKIMPSDDDQARLAKVIALVESLPPQAPLDVKRSIVAASLEAFGVRIDRVVATANGATATLDAKVETGKRKTAEALGQAEAHIARLEAEIAEVRRLIEAQIASQDALVRSVQAEKARLRAALDFFQPSKSSPPLRFRDQEN